MSSPPSTASDLRYDWYQTDCKVVITVLVKNIHQENISVNFELNRVAAAVKLNENQKYCLNFELSNGIVPDESSYKLYPSKVEIHLKKNHPLRWESLERNELDKKHKSEKKNWDAVASQLTEEKEGESSVEMLFSKIYSDGTEDQKRAMIKSFYESGGTVLSTNWNEVGKSKVDVKPPEGVEYKQWK